MTDNLDHQTNRLWCRSHDEVNGIMVFITDLHEDFLINADVWLIDGTFKTTPNCFNQTLNIMAVSTYKKTYLTISHILLNGKKEDDYYYALNHLLSQIISGIPYIQMEVIISDFEKSLMNAIQKTINYFHLNQQLNKVIKIQGCLFHFSQCLIVNCFTY